jgi:hypothetical protein
MLKLREEFVKADADGGGDLDMGEFVQAFDGGRRLRLLMLKQGDSGRRRWMEKRLPHLPNFSS